MVPVSLVCLAFEKYVPACLEFLVTRASNRLLYVVNLVVLLEVSVLGSCLCYHP